MREIKFRAWDKEIQKMSRPFSPITHPMAWKELEVIFMQYTGLRDKNEKEIYEGDIVRVYSYCDEEDHTLDEFTIHQIVWGGDYPAFELNPTIADDCNSLQSSVMGDCGESVEVIGNIHENPDLLK